MVVSVANIFGKEYIDALLSLPELVAAKQKIDTTEEQSVHFTVGLDAAAKAVLRERLGLDLSMVDAIPMRWIKGDTHAHTDTGAHEFENTYLVYLTDSPGSLVVDGLSYPIKQGTAYVFSEGLRHETVQTGVGPRLMLGPMSEKGCKVGYSGISGPGGSTIYIRQNNSDYEWSNDQISWYTLYFPSTVYNTDTAGGFLGIEFITDISFSSINNYFICSSDYIQFGSSSLKEDGSRPVITIEADNYDGLIQNGDEFSTGMNNIHVYNLVVDGAGHSTQIGGGWLGKKWFGKDASNNYFINCSTTGNLPGGAVGSGGIVGAYAGGGSDAELTLIGCSSAGTIGQLDGGIAGAYAGGVGGRVLCLSCWSTGTIQAFGGGIFGDYAGDGGYAEARNCYTTGSIGDNGGGIFGRYAGNGGGALAENCYSRGTVAADAGGIFGLGAGSNGGATSAANCYSAGAITTTGTGIFGSGKVNGISTNCYVADGGWSTAAANAVLTGVPVDVVGEIWVSAGVNQPYELFTMGYTPYTVANITADPGLQRTFESSIDPGGSTAAAIVSGKSYTILQVSSVASFSPEMLTIDSTTGVISSTPSIGAGRYVIYVRNTGSYNISVVDIVVSGGSIIIGGSTCCARRLDLQKLDYTTRAEVIGGNVAIGGVRAKQLTHGEYLRIKKAYAFKR